MKLTALSLVLAAAGPAAFAAELTELQAELLGLVEARKKLSQEISDSVFSFAEVGFHETRTWST